MIALKNKNIKSIVGLLFAGIILTALGIGLMILYPGKPATAATEKYTLNWQAANVMRAEAYGLAIPIGVTRWHVTGNYNISGGTSLSFKEDWKTPDYEGMIKDSVPLNTDWLYGYMRPKNAGNPNATISTSANEGVGFTPTSNQGEVESIGDAVRCNPQNNKDCMIATGPYSFLYDHNVPVEHEKPMLAVTMMPLRWTVKGTVCDQPYDPACKF